MASLTMRTIFLLDGLGACVSASLLGIALPAIQEWIGMPTRVLYALAGIAALFAVNAFLGYRFGGHRASKWLQAIAVANLAYCALTGLLVAASFATLTAWGVAYFSAEIAIVVGLVLVERRALRAGQKVE